MDALFHRLFLVATVTAIALHFPELISWAIIRGKRERLGPDQLDDTLRLLRKLLRIEFIFYVLLLSYACYAPSPSRILVYPLPIIHLAGLIIAERDVQREVKRFRSMDIFIKAVIGANVLEIVLLALIGLQMNGVITI
jgi:hypothetical protein